MTSLRDIKRRIANVSSTGQIIKARHGCSTKLRKGEGALEGVRPFTLN